MGVMNMPLSIRGPNTPSNSGSSAAGLYGKIPQAAFIFSILLAMFAISVLSFCIARRTAHFGHWRTVPLARWLVLGVYIDSYLFVFCSTVLQASFGLNSSQNVCSAAILLCLVCYLTSKIIIYFFLVEKVYIIRTKHKTARYKDKLYLFNTFGMLLPYCIVICLTFIFRVGEINGSGQCYIGMKLAANIPLLVFDIIINVYLTSLFLTPLIGLYSFDHGSPRLRSIAKRTFIGSTGTLLSSVANLTTLIILRGQEPGWVCFACCNADIVFSAIVLHWVTTNDEASTSTTPVCDPCKHNPTTQSRLGSHINKTVNKDYVGPGKRGGEVTTDCVGGKLKDLDDEIALGVITVHVEHRREIEEESDAASHDSDESVGDHKSAEHIQDFK